MSNDDVGRATQQADSQAAATREIVEFFDKVAARGVQPRLRSITGSCRFDIAGAGTWRVSIKDGLPTITRNDTDTAPSDSVVAVAAEDLIRLVRGEGHLNMLAAWLQGLVTIGGNLAFAEALLGSYTLEPAGSPSR
ncbi:MAG: SCP2 sterol-binding domain-containing protein [Ktedonobacterales bacterium]